MTNVSIADIVYRHYSDPSTPPPEALIGALVEREEGLADILRQAGMNFGLFPQIVAEVLAQVEMGHAVPEPERAMIRNQFNELMEQVARANRGEGPMPTP